MRLRLLFASSLALMLLACSAPPSSTPSNQASAAPHPQDQPAPPLAAHPEDGVDPSQVASTPGISPSGLSTEPSDEEPPIIGVIAHPTSGPDAAGVDYSCRTDADCAIKNVGNCCGYYPACVNVDSPTFPEKVQAECAASGLSGICGFPALTGCQCVDNRCEGVTGMTPSDISGK